MATKTISIDLEAYEALRRARKDPGESFSRVIKRARWAPTRKTAAGRLKSIQTLPTVDDATLNRLEQNQSKDLLL